jgi:hypothetical protein
MELDMRLKELHECTTTGAIAAGPMVPMFSTPKKKKKRKKIVEAEDNTKLGYLNISTQKQPVNKMTNVWTTFKPTKSKSGSIAAAKNDPDERLLKQFRGKGL